MRCERAMMERKKERRQERKRGKFLEQRAKELAGSLQSPVTEPF